MQLVIRKYCPSDKDAVCTLFSIGTLEHIPTSFYNAMTSPLYLTITLILSAAGYSLGSVFGALLFPGVWVGLIYYCCHTLYSSYVQDKLKNDMQDIPGYYLSRLDCGFWVAEAEVNGRPQIIGMVAIMAENCGKERRGELFRMIISRSCRRMGLGIRMVQNMIDFCKERGFSEMVLETSSTQTAAVALYKKLGFSLIPDKSYVSTWVMVLSRVTILRMKKCL